MKNISIDFKNIVDSLQVCICRCSPGAKGKIVYVNYSFKELFPVGKLGADSLPFENLFLDKKDFNRFLKRIKDEGCAREFEVQLKGKKGKPLWCSMSADVVVGPKGRVRFYDVSIKEISRQKKKESDLMQSRELFQTIFNNTATAITVSDKNERIVAWNPYAQRLLGMTKEKLFNLPVRSLYSKKEWSRMRAFKIRKSGIMDNIETRVIRGNGMEMDINISITILRDPDGNIIGSIGNMRDISDQKLAQARVEESEKKIRIILDNSAAAITLTDSEERLISWNKFTENLLGLTSQELHMMPISSLYPPEEWVRIRHEKIRKMGSKHHMETKIIKKNGAVVDIDLSINVLTDSDDKIVGSVGIFQDITKQKKLQEMLMKAKMAAEEASSAKSLFLANMSHEVRTPMNTIMGMIDLTLDSDMKKEQKENLVVAKDAAENLLGLLNDILDLSRVEAGKISLENIEFHLFNVVNSVCKGMSVIASKKKLGIDVDMGPDIPEILEGDPVRLRQILINLINNAIKFTHKGKITIKVSVKSRDKNGIKMHFAVVDQGIGIPKKRQSKIFSVFEQAENSTARKYGGTGLGLAICKHLVEMMDGKIWVESEEGKGSEFHFTGVFKAVEVDAAKASAMEEAKAEKLDEQTILSRLRGLKILLAEDNIVNQKIVVRILEKMGCEIEGVENGQLAVDKNDENGYDVILMDAQMPELDGFEATSIIRANEETTGKHIPIVALTARAMQEDRKKCLDAGMDGYVAKPIDRKKLFEEIIRVIQ